MGQPSQTRLHAVPDLPHPGPQGASVCKHTHSEHSSNLTSRGVMWRLSLGICEKKIFFVSMISGAPADLLCPLRHLLFSVFPSFGLF